MFDKRGEQSYLFVVLVRVAIMNCYRRRRSFDVSDRQRHAQAKMANYKINHIDYFNEDLRAKGFKVLFETDKTLTTNNNKRKQASMVL